MTWKPVQKFMDSPRSTLKEIDSFVLVSSVMNALELDEVEGSLSSKER